MNTLFRTLRYLTLLAAAVCFVSGANTARALPPEPHYDAVITVGADYVVRYNGRRMPDFDALKRELKLDVAEQPDMTVIVRADEQLDYSYVMLIVKTVDQYGAVPEVESVDSNIDGTL